MNQGYIKQCEQAQGDLETVPELGSWYWIKNIPDRFKVGNECKGLLVATTPISWHIIVPSRYDKGEVALVFDNWNHNSTFIWLPTQAQLQKMVKPDCKEWWTQLIAEFWVFNNMCEYLEPFKTMDEKVKYLSHFTSMEELWLAYVMKKKYGKVWDGETWIKEA